MLEPWAKISEHLRRFMQTTLVMLRVITFHSLFHARGNFPVELCLAGKMGETQLLRAVRLKGMSYRLKQIANLDVVKRRRSLLSMIINAGRE